MHSKFIQKIFFYNTFIFILFGILFLFYPGLDIYFSSLFFDGNQFISEKYSIIKILRVYLKNLMIIISVTSLLILLINFINKKQNMRRLINQRTKFSLIGLVVGPILGCGIIANLYFKDTWGRARPVHVEEFGGNKIFTPAFLKSDQCEKNCSWISGETSAAFSLTVGTILLKNPLFFLLNLILGFLVFFCRLSMGGHFFSDNVFAMTFMIYLAILYKNIVYLYLRKKLFYEKSFNNN